MISASRIDTAVAGSPVGRWFRLDQSGHPSSRPGTTFLTEVRAGFATFFAMAYIISVNASVLAQTGGNCECPNRFNSASPDPLCERDPAYLVCVENVHRDLITATAAISALASFCMGLLANLPIGLAPGMGVNAYFAYTVVGFHGSRGIPYSLALTAVFLEGLAFVLLTIVGLRQWLVRVIPRSIKLATGVGIGMYLTLIGLTYNAGIGLILGARETPLELAGCSIAAIDPVSGLCPPSTKMRSPTLWLGIFVGGILTALLSLYRVPGAVILGILLVSVISWPRDTTVTYFPHTDVGDSRFDFFKRVATFHPIGQTLNALDWDIAKHGSQFGVAFITLLYVDILDVTGTLYSMASFAGLMDDQTQDFEGSTAAYLVDAFSISIGSLLGLSPVATFVESGAGISEGGRTGITAIVVSLCFFTSIFFAPVFASIPPWATGGTLILVGCLMTKSVAEINWRYLGDAIPAFLTIVIMPFTYSIAYGLIAGIISYTLVNGFVWALAKLSSGRIVPKGYEDMDPSTVRLAGPVLSPWIRRLFRPARRRFRRPNPGQGCTTTTIGGGPAVRKPETLLLADLDPTSPTSTSEMLAVGEGNQSPNGVV